MEQQTLNLYNTRETSKISNRQRKESGKTAYDGNKILNVLSITNETKTAAEITHFLNSTYQKSYARNDIARALTRLRNKGLVKEDGEKICPLTSRKVIAWRIK